MTKTFKKNIRRSVTGSLGRYVAILLIIMLGVAFFTGLKLTRPAMSAIETDYIRRTALYDLRLLSTIGFDDADVEAVAGCGGVLAAEGSANADFMLIQNDEEFVYRAHMLTGEINTPELTAGAMPTQGNECLVDANRFSEDMIGQTLELADCNDGDTLSSFAYTEYTVTGLARSPLYLSVERGTTSLGSGTLNGFVLIPPEGFDLTYYTELYVKCTDEFLPYSDEYSDYIEVLSNTVEDAASASILTHYDALVSDAEQEIADAEAELADKKAEAEAELDDAKAQLDDALAQLEDGEAQLRDAKTQLEDAERQLNEGAEQLLPGFTSWQEALDAGWTAYLDGQSALNSAVAEGKKQLSDSRAQLAALEKTYQSGAAELAEGQAQYERYDALWEQGYAQYTAGLAEYQQKYDIYQKLLEIYEAARDSLQQVVDNLPPGISGVLPSMEVGQLGALLERTGASLAEGKAELDAAYEELTAQREELDRTKATLDDSAAQLAQLRAQLDAGWTEYDNGAAELDSQQAQQQALLDSAYLSLIQFQNGINSYNTGLEEYEQGAQELEEGWTEYNDGLAEYEQGRATLDREVADAEKKIYDGKRELNDLKEDDPELYVLDRSSNTGYVTFENDSQIVDNLAAVFPVFFFLIAALVCSTTMTRMVDDDRTQIGTLRALGYSRGAILTKYLLYSGSAATFGCLIGYFGGGFLFPLVIWKAYQMLYKIPGFICVYDPALFVLALLASLLCSAGTTYLACRHEMTSAPAELIRPKAPSAGKRIFLERITVLWSHLKFLHKVSLRNIFRFKKRMFMMILGIAGCTALVLTGFGIQDSVADIGNYQFDDIQKYDINVMCNHTITSGWLDEVDEALGGDIGASAVALMSSGELTGGAATKTVYLVASDDPNLPSLIDLHLDGETVPYPGQGEVLLTEKLARLVGAGVGDTVTVSVSDLDKAELRVAGIVENYVYNYLYMTGQTYEQSFSGGYEPKTLLIRAAEDTDEYSLAAALTNTYNVTSVSVVSDVRNSIDNMMQSLNYVVAMVLISAGALAFIVLFNLGNINISERVREIATIKVLGFHARETGAYVFRENIILSLMGIVCGLPLGVALHRFVMSQIQVDMVSFKTVIRPVSFGLTVVMVVFFSVVTDLILRRKIARIDMAESLKSIE